MKQQVRAGKSGSRREKQEKLNPLGRQHSNHIRQFRDDLFPYRPDPLLESLKGVPVDLEIGCGVGWHAIEYSNENPDRILIAVEHTRMRFQKFNRRYQNSGSPMNLLPVHANAVTWVAQYLPDDFLENIYIFYPNPYPKASQANLRWHRMPFMGRLIRSMKEHARLTMTTNELFYAREAEYYFRKHWGLAGSMTRITEQEPRTHFEKKYLQRGEALYELNFRKI